ncbi:short chain enoyl-CoA hydratase [Sinobaca qinghaiensis]|uniref:Short chain enoyl-CoA hydratase n=1 Tax=Sinobaca qinghaiensis TaxID=342944 RepID=A0A419UWI5_9BACL|nr:enoyl-CoA hydratase [Sinobaca qinghaiensis]RKD69491.1 short chain enoyl-CoA hydratase [Sinobaca qinghaiensis]
MPEPVTRVIDPNGTATITLQRPEAANALSIELLHALTAIMDELAVQPDVRCVILTGKGDKAFCAGADLKERAQMTPAETKDVVALIGSVVARLAGMPQPTLAMMNGSAFGGGLELALACDIRIAADHIKTGLTETSLGIIPGAGGTQRLPRAIGMARAKELIFTAEKISAADALAIGLVEHVVPASALAEKTAEMSERICRNAPIAVKQAKAAMNAGADIDLPSGLKIEQEAYHATLWTEDRREGLNAFREKRSPVYKGR